jgi:hypothetical protein
LKSVVWKFRIVEIRTIPFKYIPKRSWRYPERPAARVVP